MLVITLLLTLKMLYESRSRTGRDGCGVESQFSINSCGTLGKALKLAESQLPHQYNVGIMLVTQDHRPAI